MAKSDLVQNYCAAVERDGTAHPIQRAQPILPFRTFYTAADLYAYSVCSYDGDGTPLVPSEPVERAEWLIFDNVYSRTTGGKFPANAERARARSAGFRAGGGPRRPEQAAKLWAGAVEHFGKRGTAVSGSTPPVPREIAAAQPREVDEPPVREHRQTVNPASVSGERTGEIASAVDSLVAGALVEPRNLMSRLGRPESTVFYSNPWLTLKPGPLYIAGFKPGGDERVPSQTMAKLLRWPKTRPWSLYLDEDDWQATPLQRNIKSFADATIPGGSSELRHIFSTNSIFAHANDATVIAGIEDRLFAICWPWHQRFLEIVRPQTIVTIGNSQQSAYRLFAGAMHSTRSLGPDIPVYSTFSVRAVSGVIPLPSGTLYVKLLGLPHLSRCSVTSRPEVTREIQERGWLTS